MENTVEPSPAKVEEEVSKVVEQAKQLQESSSVLISRSYNEEISLRQRALSLESSIRRLQKLLDSLVSNKIIDAKLAEKLEDDLHRSRCLLQDGEAAAFLPSKPQAAFLRMFLGPINVRASRKDVQLKVKEEYNSYRDRTALLFLLFPATLLVLRSWIWNGCFPAFPVQCYQAWLLFLYTGLALRENILLVNGSDIRSWWVFHHYCAMIMALVSLTWEIKGQPDCAQKQRGVQLFLQWAMMQGVAMLLQNRYQRQRLYTRIALGKAKRMDVVWGETAGVDGQLWLLCLYSSFCRLQMLDILCYIFLSIFRLLKCSRVNRTKTQRSRSVIYRPQRVAQLGTRSVYIFTGLGDPSSRVIYVCNI